jgi:hypothetical protein
MRHACETIKIRVWPAALVLAANGREVVSGRFKLPRYIPAN